MDKKTAELEAVNLQDEWIVMVHPGLEDSYQKVPVASFEEVWAELGWQRANDLLDAEGQPLSWSEPTSPEDAPAGELEEADEPEKEE